MTRHHGQNLPSNQGTSDHRTSTAGQLLHTQSFGLDYVYGAHLANHQAYAGACLRIRHVEAPVPGLVPPASVPHVRTRFLPVSCGRLGHEKTLSDILLRQIAGAVPGSVRCLEENSTVTAENSAVTAVKQQ